MAANHLPRPLAIAPSSARERGSLMSVRHCGRMLSVLVTVRAVSPDDTPVVYCEPEIGALTGNWRGEAPPVVGMSEHIELEADGPLVWDRESAIVSTDAVSEHGQVLTGRIEDVEDDFVAVRVGTALMALSVEGDPPLGALGREVTVAPASFSMWPIRV
jgi:hypothetical protein